MEFLGSVDRGLLPADTLLDLPGPVDFTSYDGESTLRTPPSLSPTFLPPSPSQLPPLSACSHHPRASLIANLGGRPEGEVEGERLQDGESLGPVLAQPRPAQRPLCHLTPPSTSASALGTLARHRHVHPFLKLQL